MGWCTDSFYRDIRVKKEQKEKSCIECKKYGVLIKEWQNTALKLALKIDDLQAEIENKKELEILINEWCEKIEGAIAKGSHFDTFTQIYYDKFCEATGRENSLSGKGFHEPKS